MARFALRTRSAQPDRRLDYFFCFSLLLHGLVAALPLSVGRRPPDEPVGRQSISVTISGATRQEPAPGSSRSVVAGRLPATVRSTLRTPAAPATVRMVSPRSSGAVDRLPESGVPPVPALDTESLREQARTLAREVADPDWSGRPLSPGRYVPDRQSPAPDERAMLAALSKRLDRPRRIVSEQVMNDGSRFIRFSGNTCLHIPKHLPPGRESEGTPALFVPTTCP